MRLEPSSVALKDCQRRSYSRLAQPPRLLPVQRLAAVGMLPLAKLSSLLEDAMYSPGKELRSWLSRRAAADRMVGRISKPARCHVSARMAISFSYWGEVCVH